MQLGGHQLALSKNGGNPKHLMKVGASSCCDRAIGRHRGKDSEDALVIVVWDN